MATINKRLTITTICLRCGKQFFPFRQARKHGPQRYCSRKCGHAPLPLFERFWRYAVRADGCWPWTGNKDKDGYGMIAAFPTQGKNMRASHASWALLGGNIPPNMRICHSCDNPGCVNPQHLFLGTDADNHADAARKGRHCRGEKNYRAKLTTLQVKKIREQAGSGMQYATIAKEYGVTPEAIAAIAKRINWKHVP